MFNFENCAIPTSNGVEVPVNKQETAKMIFENMDAIFTELSCQINLIEAAVYGQKLKNEDAREPADECILGTLNRQRNMAEQLLKTAVHIREGLW